MAQIGTLSIGVNIAGAEEAMEEAENLEDGLEDMSDEAEDSTDRLERLNQRLENTKERLGNMKDRLPDLSLRNIVGVGAGLGALSGLGAVLGVASQAASGLISKFNQLSGIAQGIIGGVVSIGSAILLPTQKLKGLLGVGKRVLGVVKNIGSALAGIGSRAGSFLGKIGSRIPSLPKVSVPSLGSLGTSVAGFTALPSIAAANNPVTPSPARDTTTLAATGSTTKSETTINNPKIEIKGNDLSNMTRGEKRRFADDIIDLLGDDFNRRVE